MRGAALSWQGLGGTKGDFRPKNVRTILMEYVTRSNFHGELDAITNGSKFGAVRLALLEYEGHNVEGYAERLAPGLRA
jgi:hypothetical protein